MLTSIKGAGQLILSLRALSIRAAMLEFKNEVYFLLTF